jgi:hypothetical protein
MRKRLFFATVLMALWLISTTLSEANQKRRYFPNQIENNKFGSNILLEGSPQQIARFENLLDRISEVPKGYETIRTISDSGHELTIRHAKYVVLSAGRTLAPMSRKLINGKGDDVTILFSAHIPDSGSHMVYNAQNKLIEFTAIQNLFHELAHAMHMMKGSWRYFASEKQAIEEENVFRRDLAMIRHTPITERYKKTGVLINNTDDIFVISEWFGPSIIKKPEPGEYAEDGQQTTSGTGIKTSLGIQRRK